MHSSSGPDVVASIRRKLLNARVKVAAIVEKCHVKDRNRDGVVAFDDLDDAFQELTGATEFRVSRRELLKLAHVVMDGRFDGTTIQYERLVDVLDPSRRRDARGERWLDEDGAGSGGFGGDADTRWATRPGSVGEWLKNAACPAEIKNFKTLVGCLERFERETGMKVAMQENGGFEVPLGPNLRAGISFFMT
jgi:hypothetical protein